uniref:Uncharacterized protein n=1 Tax=Aegilops tauschii subsp. strangulata TaxID=200361 RepID=A0A453LW58_AEGTS
QKFHKVWGQLMKTGYQNSRFAHQRLRDLRACTAAKLQTLGCILPTSITARAKITCP